MEPRPHRNAFLRRLQARWIRWRLAHQPADALERGVTVVVAHHKTPELLAICLKQTIANSSSDLKRILVIDNASGGLDLAALDVTDPRVELIELDTNLGHQWALECGFWRVETDVAVALDSDAWPIRSDWLEVMRTDLESGSAAIGAWHPKKDYLHPSFAAMKTAVIRRHRLSPLKRLPRRGADRGGMRELDVLQHLSWKLHRLGYRVTRLDTVEPWPPMPKAGGTYGGIGFHMWWGTSTPSRGDMTTTKVARGSDTADRWRSLVPFDLAATETR